MKSSDKDLCGICDKPFPMHTTRFLHFMNHVTLHEAVGYFDKRGNWWFERTKEYAELINAQRRRDIDLLTGKDVTVAGAEAGA
jgi:hypothetical protein